MTFVSYLVGMNDLKSQANSRAEQLLSLTGVIHPKQANMSVHSMLRAHTIPAARTDIGSRKCTARKPFMVASGTQPSFADDLPKGVVMAGLHPMCL